MFIATAINVGQPRLVLSGKFTNCPEHVRQVELALRPEGILYREKKLRVETSENFRCADDHDLVCIVKKICELVPRHDIDFYHPRLRHARIEVASMVAA